MKPENSEYIDDVSRLMQFGVEELSTQFEAWTPRLMRMIQFRLRADIRARVDEADVIQEVFLEASRRLLDYVANPQTTPYVWIRSITRHVLWRTHRFHIDTAKRTVEAESPKANRENAQSDVVALQLADSITSPSSRVARAELHTRLRTELEELDSFEREVLCLKQLERLSFSEIADELKSNSSSVRRAFIRATMRLKKLLTDDVQSDVLVGSN